jgi:hypothetical protein
MSPALALLVLAFPGAPQQPESAPQDPTPAQRYETWWQGIAARPLPALRTGFVFEGAFTAVGADAPVFTMRVEGTLDYRDARHVRVQGTLSASMEDGSTGSGRFTVLVAGERMYLDGSAAGFDADGVAEEPVEGSASLSTAKLRESAKIVQQAYATLGMGALGVGDSLLEREVGEWLHPVLLWRSTTEQMRVERFTLEGDAASCTMRVDVDAFRSALDSALAMAELDEDPELRAEMDAEMEPVLRWLGELSFEHTMDRATGLPHPFAVELSLPALLFDDGEPPIEASVAVRLVDPELAPEFDDALFTPQADLIWFDFDPFIDMALGALQVMTLEAEADLDAEF